ncbi:hypothetical protein [Arthrobacter sp. SLBN-112]|uniref:hypothetical protein n=1 Tax=Arthrobacter sp. SLBN-112 TaxID=2768452 RepID=UPI002811428C|nr:hypothetical protein [Arthrobacter sp. SLBN-112]
MRILTPRPETIRDFLDTWVVIRRFVNQCSVPRNLIPNLTGNAGNEIPFKLHEFPAVRNGVAHVLHDFEIDQSALAVIKDQLKRFPILFDHGRQVMRLNVFEQVAGSRCTVTSLSLLLALLLKTTYVGSAAGGNPISADHVPDGETQGNLDRS